MITRMEHSLEEAMKIFEGSLSCWTSREPCLEMFPMVLENEKLYSKASCRWDPNLRKIGLKGPVEKGCPQLLGRLPHGSVPGLSQVIITLVK